MASGSGTFFQDMAAPYSASEEKLDHQQITKGRVGSVVPSPTITKIEK